MNFDNVMEEMRLLDITDPDYINKLRECERKLALMAGHSDEMITAMYRAQDFLRGYGYTLTSYGQRKVTFFKTDIPRDEDGLLKDGDHISMNLDQFNSFLRRLSRMQ